MDEATRREIDKVAWQVLRDAGIRQPPVRIENVLHHLSLYREYYDLQSPGFLDRAQHKIQIHGRRLVDVVQKIRLKAVLFYDEDRIVVDQNLPLLKRDHPSFHEVAHRILPWHGTYFRGDTAQTLDPDWHEALEAEANCGASALMFCGPVFTSEACETVQEWATVAALKARYGKTYVTTLRWYVEHGPALPMAMLMSTPLWKEKPADQPKRWRYFVGSKQFHERFGNATAEDVLSEVDGNVLESRSGLVGDFTSCLTDVNGERHEFRLESFYNTYDILTLLVHKRRLDAERIVVPRLVAATASDLEDLT